MIKRRSEKECSFEFIKDFIIMLAFLLSAFWIVITGVYLIPQISNSNNHILTPFCYSLGTLALSIIIMYTGLKYTGLLGDDKKSTKKEKEKKK